MTKQELKSLYWLRKEIQREKRILAEGQRMAELQSRCLYRTAKEAR